MAIVSTYPTAPQKIAREIKKLLCINTEYKDRFGKAGNAVSILTSTHTLYVAHWLGFHLGQDFSIDVSSRYDLAHDRGQPYIVICPQIFPELPKRFVVFQMEQSIHPKWFTESYFAILKRALAIFDYSMMNVEFLQAKGIAKEKIFYLPLSPIADYAGFLSSHGHKLTNASKDIDVLFYGDPGSPRRREIIGALARQCDLHIAYKLFGDGMINLIRRAKVVINIHHQESSLLETTRVYEALSLGAAVVSEEADDMQYHQELKGMVRFVKVGDVAAMIDNIHRLLNHWEQYQGQQAQLAGFNQHQDLLLAARRYLGAQVA